MPMPVLPCRDSLDDKVSFESFLTKQSSTLLASKTEQFETTLQSVAKDALRWFDFDRATLLPNRSSAYNEQQMLSFCQEGIADIFSVGKNVDLAPYLKLIARRKSPLVFTQQAMQSSNLQVLQLMAEQGVVWHCLLPLNIFGHNWGAIAAARFQPRFDGVGESQLARFKLLGEVWASYWQYAILSRNARTAPAIAISSTDPTANLSVRQKEVLSLLASGLTAKQVGEALNLSSRTVESHKYKIMDILQLQSNAQLVQFAIGHGLIVG